MRDAKLQSFSVEVTLEVVGGSTSVAHGKARRIVQSRYVPDNVDARVSIENVTENGSSRYNVQVTATGESAYQEIDL